MFGVKVLLLDDLELEFAREIFGAVTGQDEVRGFFHDCARKQDWILHSPDSSHGTRLQGPPVHDRRIHFVGAGTGEDGAATSIEKRIVLKHVHCGYNRIKTGAAILQNGVARIKRSLQSPAQIALHLRRDLFR